MTSSPCIMAFPPSGFLSFTQLPPRPRRLFRLRPPWPKASSNAVTPSAPCHELPEFVAVLLAHPAILPQPYPQSHVSSMLGS